MARRILLLSLALLLLFSGVPLVSAQADQRCFPETNQCIGGQVRQFWEQNGGLAVFGFPTGPQGEISIEGRPYQAQSFERNRLELHPENQRPYNVLLGRLGADRLAQQGRDPFTFPKSQAQAGCRYFPETQHNVCGDILSAWHARGLELDRRAGTSEAENLALFGLPLSDLMTETIQGADYQVQWFERARFELHPENQPPYQVLLGLLGNETRDGAAPPAPPAQATCADVPPPTDATTPTPCVAGGAAFEATATKLAPGERVVMYVSAPDGKVGDFPVIYGDPSPDAAGSYHARGALSADSAPGIYALTFEGTTSHKLSVLYIRVVPRDPAAPPAANLSLLPPGQNASASPASGRRVETVFTFRTSGFPAGMTVLLSVVQSDGKLITAPFTRTADGNGNAGRRVELHTELTDPVGIYLAIFESEDHAYRATVPVRILP